MSGHYHRRVLSNCGTRRLCVVNNCGVLSARKGNQHFEAYCLDFLQYKVFAAQKSIFSEIMCFSPAEANDRLCLFTWKICRA